MNETREQRIKRWDAAGTSNSERIDELLNEIDGTSNSERIDELLNEIDGKITELLDDGKLVIDENPALQKVPSFITQSTFIK
jgi:hypothetical protein